jgi:hypothetical protein
MLLEFGVAREVLPESTAENFVDPENEGVLRVLARTDWRYSRNHRLSLFFSMTMITHGRRRQEPW